MDRVIQQWLERAAYDLGTARSLLSSRHYLYVTFMCQQCLEKSLKALITSKGATPPFVHNVVRLAEDAGILSEMSAPLQLLLADINPFYIKARYGEYKEALSKVCTGELANRFLKETEELHEWLRQKIK